ncbi:MAG: CAP domain-containing protein [Microgenomates group bacterium]
MSFLLNWFLPHHGNNHKAYLIRSYSLFLLSFVFVFLQIFLNFFLLAKPAVLGYSSNITPERIIELTNKERAKLGLPGLKENKLLSEAARQKAADMFAFNYWAHVSPSGRSPWSFFADVGYKYQYAGENLARDFTDPDSVVQAWMNSPTHRENITNSHYQEIGVAVVNGTLQGAQTTLVVQLFGTPYGAVAPSGATQGSVPATKKITTVTEKPKVVSEETISENSLPAPLTSPLDLTKAIAIFTVGVLLGVFAMDFFLVSRRQTPRLSSRSLAQMMFLIFVLIASLLVKEGAVL